MDYGFRFEQLLNQYLGKPNYVTYASNWDDTNERTALLFTACIKKYDQQSTGDIAKKLQYYMEELFEDDDNKSISKKCIEFLESISK